MKKASTSTSGNSVPGTTSTTAQTISQGPDMEVQRVVIRPGGEIPMHSHPFGQSYCVVEGQGVITTPRGKTNVDRGDAGYFAPNEPHSWQNTGKADLVFISSSAGEQGILEANETTGGKWNIHYHS